MKRWLDFQHTNETLKIRVSGSASSYIIVAIIYVSKVNISVVFVLSKSYYYLLLFILWWE